MLAQKIGRFKIDAPAGIKSSTVIAWTALLLAFVVKVSAQDRWWIKSGPYASCYERFYGCSTCNNTICFSCSDGLYYVPDKALCVYDCTLAPIFTSDADQSPYYADHYNKLCLKCGPNCNNCVANRGCASCASSNDTSKSFFLKVNNGLGSCASCNSNLSSCLLCSDSATCTVMDSKVLSTGEACTDANCRICSSNKSVCDYCKSGYILNSGACSLPNCKVSNCLTCASSTDTACSSCKSGYYLSSSTTCSTCPGNCTQCTSSSVCTLCNNGFVLSTTGTCILACSTGQLMSIQRLPQPIFDVLERKSCLLMSCDSSCEYCLKGSNSTMCTSCPLGRYLSLLDTSQQTGSCLTKTAKPDANDLLVYVSNLGTGGDFQNLRIAIVYCRHLISQYNLKSDGSLLTIRLLLYKGTHYVDKIQYVTQSLNLDNKYLNFKLYISPYYCSLVTSPDTSICANDTSTKVNVNVNIGAGFSFNLPKETIIENIVFDFTNSTGNATSVNPPITSPRLLFSMNHIFTLPDMNPTANGISNNPKFLFNASAIQNVFFNYRSIVMIRNSGEVTMQNSLFTNISAFGALAGDTYFTYYKDSKNTNYQNTFITYSTLKSTIPSVTNGCSSTYTCNALVIISCNITNFYPTHVLSSNFDYFQATIFLISGTLVQFLRFKGPIQFESNLVSNMIRKYSLCNAACNRISYSPPLMGLMYIGSYEGKILIASNTFQDIFLDSTLFYIAKSALPLLTTENLMMINNQFTRVGIFSENIIILRYLLTAFQNMTPSYMTAAQIASMVSSTSSQIGCVDTSISFNNFTDIGGCLRQLNLFSVTCRNYKIPFSYTLSTYLSNATMNSLDLSGMQTRNLTIITGGQNFTINLNYFSMIQNNFERTSCSSSLINIYSLQRVLIQLNMFSHVGFYTDKLLNMINPNIKSPSTTCTNRQNYQAQAINSQTQIIQVLYSAHLLMDTNTINEPRYNIILQGSQNSIILYSSNCLGIISFKNNLMLNFEGIYGQFNEGTLGLPQLYDFKEIGQAVYLPTLVIVNKGYLSKIEVIRTNITNFSFRKDPSYELILYEMGPLAATGTVTISDLYVSNMTCYGTCVFLSKQLSSFKNMNFENVSCKTARRQNSKFIIVKISDLTSNLIQLTNITFDKITTAIPINIENTVSLKGSATISPNVIISNVIISNSELNPAGIMLNSPSLKINIIGLSFLNNIVDKNSFGLGFTAFDSFLIQNSTFKSNSGVYSNDLAIVNINSGTLTFQNCSFSGAGAASSNSLDVYDSLPGIYVFSSYSVFFTGCIFQDYIKVKNYGAVLVRNSNVTFNSCTFQNNYGEEGAALYVTQNSAVNLNTCIMTGNNANMGGCIEANVNSIVTSSNSVFSNNYAKDSAVLYISYKGNFIDSNSTISGNKATVNSVGTFSDSKGSILNGTIILQNNITTAQSTGCAINIFQSVLTFTGITMSNNFSPSDKNIQILSSTLTITSSNFTDSTGLYSYSIYSSQSGGYINSLLSTVKVSNSNFQNGIANNGGAIYSLKSELEVTNSTFTNNYAESSGGAIYCQLAVILSVSGSTFVNNSAISGGSIQLQISYASNIISNSVFIGYINPMFVHVFSSNIQISNCSFSQSDQYNPTSLSQSQLSTLMNGTGIILEGPTNFNLHGSTFQNMLASEGIIMMSQPDKTSIHSNSNYKYILYNNTFANLTTYGAQGGAIYLINPFPSNISGNIFDSNIAKNGDGGALKITYLTTDISMFANMTVCVLSNSFINNFAQTKGGAISWDSIQPTGIVNNTFSNNKATNYGNNIAGVGFKIVQITQDIYTENFKTIGDTKPINIDVYNSGVVPYQLTTLNSSITGILSGASLPTMYFAIIDNYNYILKSGENKTLKIELDSDTKSLIASTVVGTSAISSSIGLFNFTDLSIYSEPGKAQILQFIDSDRVVSNQFNVSVTPRNCSIGEQMSAKGVCSLCLSPIYYLLEASTVPTSCNTCKSYLDCRGGSEIYPASGFWRSTNTTDKVHVCFINEACIGYDQTTKDPLGQCKEGYQGKLCASCIAGYKKNQDLTCSKCYPIWASVIFMLCACLGFIILLTFMIHSTTNINSRTVFNINVLTKVLINHIQLMAITISFNFDWPGSIKNLFAGFQPIMDISSELIPIDCLIEKSRNTDASNQSFPAYYVSVILTAATPWILLCLIWVYWEVVENIRIRKLDKQSRSYKDDIKSIRRTIDDRKTTTSFIVSFIIYPSIMKAMFEMMNCYHIDGVEYLVNAMDKECYKGTHLILLLSVVLPTILLFGLGVPLSSFFALKKIRSKLDDDENKVCYGFLYSGYRKKYYYWESVSMIRKVIFVFILTYYSTRGNIYQILLVIMIQSICIIIQVNSNPYIDRRYNRLETISYIAGFVTVFAAYYFVVGEIALVTYPNYSVNQSGQLTAYKNALIVCVILLQCLFFILAIYQFHIEIRNFVMKKYPDFYQKYYNCNNQKKKINDIARIYYEANIELKGELRDEMEGIVDEIVNQNTLDQNKKLVKLIVYTLKNSKKLKAKRLSFLFDDVLKARQIVIESMDLNIERDLENLLNPDQKLKRLKTNQEYEDDRIKRNFEMIQSNKDLFSKLCQNKRKDLISRFVYNTKKAYMKKFSNMQANPGSFLSNTPLTPVNRKKGSKSKEESKMIKTIQEVTEENSEDEEEEKTAHINKTINDEEEKSITPKSTISNRIQVQIDSNNVEPIQQEEEDVNTQGVDLVEFFKKYYHLAHKNNLLPTLNQNAEDGQDSEQQKESPRFFENDFKPMDEEDE